MNKIGQKFEFDYYNENDGYASIHVHFHCPVCGEKEAGTDYLSEWYPSYHKTEKAKFSCEECGAEFETTEDGKIKLIGSPLY